MKWVKRIFVWSLVATASVANATWSASQEPAPAAKSDTAVQSAVKGIVDEEVKKFKELRDDALKLKDAVTEKANGPAPAQPSETVFPGQVRFTTEVLILKSDWQSVADVEGAERDLKEALGDVKLDERFGKPTLANASRIFFSSVNAYSPEKFDAFVAWLRRYEILRHQQAGDAPAEGKSQYDVKGVFRSRVRVPAEKYLRPQVEPVVLPLVETTQEWTWTILKGDPTDDYEVRRDWTTRRKPLGAKESTTEGGAGGTTPISFTAPPNRVVLMPSHLADVRLSFDVPALMAIVVIHTGPQHWPVEEPAQTLPKLSMPDEVLLDSVTSRTVKAVAAPVLGPTYETRPVAPTRRTPNSGSPLSPSTTASGATAGGGSNAGGRTPEKDEGGELGASATNKNSNKEKVSTFTLRHARAAEAGQLLERLLRSNVLGKDLRFAVDASTNRLIVVSNSSSYRDMIKELLETVDQPPANAPTRQAGTPDRSSGRSDDDEVDRADRPSLEVLSALALDQEARSIRTADRLCERLNADPTGAQAETQSLEKQLRREIAEAFESRQRFIAAQVADFEERLAHVKQVFELRERAKEQILRRRLEELRTPESIGKMRDKLRDEAKLDKRMRNSTERPTAGTPRKEVAVTENKAEAEPEPSSTTGTSKSDEFPLSSASSPARVILPNSPDHYRHRFKELKHVKQVLSDKVNRLRQTANPADYEDPGKELRNAEVALESWATSYQFARDELQAHVRLLELDVQDATTRLGFLQSEYERKQTLFNKSILTRSEVESSRVQVEEAKTRLEKARVLFDLYRKVDEPLEPAPAASNADTVPAPSPSAPATEPLGAKK